MWSACVVYQCGQPRAVSHAPFEPCHAKAYAPALSLQTVLAFASRTFDEITQSISWYPLVPDLFVVGHGRAHRGNFTALELVTRTRASWHQVFQQHASNVSKAFDWSQQSNHFRVHTHLRATDDSDDRHGAGFSFHECMHVFGRKHPSNCCRCPNDHSSDDVFQPPPGLLPLRRECARQWRNSSWTSSSLGPEPERWG